MLKHNSFFIYLFISLNVLFAQENIYDKILEYRCKNDTDIVLIENEAAIALNNYKSVRLNSIFAFDFSSTLNFNLSSEKDKSGFSVQPSVSAGMPLYNNLGLKLSAPYSYKMGKSSQDFSLGLSGDIYSQARKRKKQEIETSLEALKEAEKKVKSVKELAEKKLLTDIQKILSEYSALLAKRLSGIQADINYKQILAEGYSETSSKLRTARLNLISSERTEKETEFSFEVSARLFFESCGLDIPKKDEDEFFIRLAKSLPKQKLISMENLKAENYKPLLKAENDYKKLLEKNKMDLSPFSASASLGYSYTMNQNKNISSGLQLMFPGVRLDTGLSLSLDSASVPAMQVSFSINPLAIYDYYLNKKNVSLKEAGEKIKLGNTRNNFAKEFNTFKLKWEQLEWQQIRYAEELDIYKENAEEHAKWFQRGLINALENKQASLQYITALLGSADSNIAVHIFNAELKEAFDIEEK
ncbi:hypothetical protein HH007_08850 [Treponema denticola]|uniref:Outer membrane efflux protein n=1 Tax=Treponema denticola (strain ATCC 35405 / DSM 14222 / CIP 103919 / JCM 8153 / KCTC 15104) TaxID=243275 RepID=Q73KD3_TREDE|nr:MULTISPECIES: hypothetical protein [Treponema]AAS12804.1 conserved hypothetical protein [Treponema denticola ATCC 35405]EMB38783.1 hypothetical protein HMPREF9721_00962 [Treponema denticola ATCC 35404]EMB40203.1 hypothetical protein HMPREF9735_00867 [Treponema denticola ATCC 33521]HCY95253.1 hypothetical protein [Treponema sp.]